MPVLTPASLQTKLKAKQFVAAYLLSGEELQFIENTANAIETALNIDEMGKEVFFGSDLHVNDLIMSAQTLPFMSGARFIVVKDSNKIKSADAKLLSSFIAEGLPDTSHLLFIWPEKLSKKNNALSDALAKSADCVEFRRLYDNEIPSWIHQRCKDAGKSIDPQAAQYLADQTGNSLLDISNEIEKLMLFCAGVKSISLADVKASVGNVKQYDLNDICDAVERRDLSNALVICESLLGGGEAGLRILASVARALRRFTVAKSMLEEEKSCIADIKSQLRLHPYFARDFFSNLQKFTLAELTSSLTQIQKADLSLKSSGRPEVSVLQSLLISALQKVN